MTYKELQKEVGDYTGVYTNLVLEDEITWNVIGVLTNIIKCDCIGVKVSTRSLALHCNLSERALFYSIGVLRNKGIISKKGFTVNYDALKVLIEKCNLKSKELSKASKTAKNAVSDRQSNRQENCKICSKKTAKNAVIINNINNNNTLYDTNMEDLSKEVKRTLFVTKKKEYIVPKVQIRVNDLRTPSAERATRLRNRIEVANKKLLCELENLVEGSDDYLNARDLCYECFKEYRDHLVNAAKSPKCTAGDYDIISSFYEGLNGILEYYQELIDKRYGVTSIKQRVHPELSRYVHRPVQYEDTPEDFGLHTLSEVS